MELDRGRLRDSIDSARERIARAAERSGRRAEAVRLMAVTKTLPIAHALAAAEAGVTLFGENRVQEAVEKWSGSKPGELHLIGHLQRNKARAAASLFDAVDSIDKIETARALARACAEAGRRCDILLEVNTSGEESKSGVREEGELLELLAAALALPELRVRGLLTIGPLTEEEPPVRRAFARLRSLLESCARAAPGAGLETLSMGMSSDFEIAVEEGSTLVRLGTVLFGPRGG